MYESNLTFGISLLFLFGTRAADWTLNRARFIAGNTDEYCTLAARKQCCQIPVSKSSHEVKINFWIL